MKKIILLPLLAVITLLLAQCGLKSDFESFAPAILPEAKIDDIVANGGGSLYCSISGGCPIRITGKNFYKRARVYVGSYECLDTVISDDFTTIDCNVGPAQNGVYDIRVKNIDNQYSTLTNPASATVLQFSYASFLYLGVQNAPGQVYGYAQHPTTGALLTVSGSPFTTGGNGTYGVAMSINNKFLYAADVNTDTISMFSINPLTGRLTSGPTTASDSAGGKGPNGLFAHPSGNFLYVSNFIGNDVSGYSIGADGTLTRLAGSPFSTSGAATINGLVGSADGRFLFAAAGSSNAVSSGVVAFTVDQSTGALTVVPGSPFRNTLGGVTVNSGDGISIHPNGRWLYMGLYDQHKMAGWNIDQSTGELTPIEAPIDNGSPTVPDDGGSASTVSADGLFLYGTAFSRTDPNGKKVIVYSINPSTGGLTRVTSATTAGGPNDIRIDTTGNYAYTCNTVNSPSISAFSVDKSTGALSPLTPASYAIPTANSGPGIMIMQTNH